MRPFVPLLLLVVCACGAAPATFTEVNDQVLKVSCALSGCHEGGAASGGMDLKTDPYQALVGAAAVGISGKTRVVPSKPDQSYVMEKLTHAMPAAGTQMPPPPADPLEANRVELIRSWIADGAKQN